MKRIFTFWNIPEFIVFTLFYACIFSISLSIYFFVFSFFREDFCGFSKMWWVISVLYFRSLDDLFMLIMPYANLISLSFLLAFHSAFSHLPVWLFFLCPVKGIKKKRKEKKIPYILSTYSLYSFHFIL